MEEREKLLRRFRKYTVQTLMEIHGFGARQATALKTAVSLDYYIILTKNITNRQMSSEIEQTTGNPVGRFEIDNYRSILLSDDLADRKVGNRRIRTPRNKPRQTSYGTSGIKKVDETIRLLKIFYDSRSENNFFQKVDSRDLEKMEKNISRRNIIVTLSRLKEGGILDKYRDKSERRSQYEFPDYIWDEDDNLDHTLRTYGFFKTTFNDTEQE